MTLGQSIAAARKQRGLRQCDLATLAYISPGYLALLEQNRRRPSPDVYRALSTALDVDLQTVCIDGPSARACKVGGCERQHHAKGYCVMHYGRWKRRQS